MIFLCIWDLFIYFVDVDHQKCEKIAQTQQTDKIYGSNEDNHSINFNFLDGREKKLFTSYKYTF